MLELLGELRLRQAAWGPSGRRNHYEPVLDAHLRHALESIVTIEQLFSG